jgi:hypothetical protein
MQIALYARVLTTWQADNELLLPDQLHQMRQCAEGQKYTILNTFGRPELR